MGTGTELVKGVGQTNRAVPMTLAIPCMKWSAEWSNLLGVELSAVRTPRSPPGPKMGAPMAEGANPKDRCRGGQLSRRWE